MRFLHFLAAWLPAGCVLTQTDPTQPPEVLDVPMELVHGVPLIEVEIAGKGPFTMLVDTGVTPSGMDLTTARAIGLPVSADPVGEAAGAGNAKSAPIHRAEIRGLRIGGREFGDFASMSSDLRPIGKALGRDLHGILGHGFLKGRVVEFDYPAGRFRVYAELPAATGESSWETALVFRRDDILPILELSVNGDRIRATLDTGSSNGLVLFPPGYRKLGLEAAARAGAASSVRGARGRSSIRAGSVDSIRLGPFDCRQKTVHFADRGASDPTRDGNFGGGLLVEFAVLLDYRTKRIRFTRS